MSFLSPIPNAPGLKICTKSHIKRVKKLTFKSICKYSSKSTQQQAFFFQPGWASSGGGHIKLVDR